MSSLQKIIYLKREQYETLLSNNNTGQIQSGGVTLTGVQDDNIYFITDETISASDLGNDFILPVSNGGTGKTQFTAGSVLVGNGQNELNELAATDQNTGNTIVKRDSTGGFSMGLLEVQSIIATGGASTTATLGTSSQPFHQIFIGGTTTATVNASSTNPKITFQEGIGTQPVHLIYSDFNTYRAPAGLKIAGGTDANPAWLEVEGSIFSNGGTSKGYRVPHTGDTDGNVGNGTTPVYVTNGQITAGTALHDLAYISKPATENQTTTYLRGDGSWVDLSGMGLSTAMHFIGIATVDITDGGTQDPKVGGVTTVVSAGDVVIDKNTRREYVWSTANKWEMLGFDASQAYSKTTSGNTFISSISQATDGTVTADSRALNTSGEWSGSAGSLKNTNTIWGQDFNGTQNITGDMTDVGPKLRLPENADTDFYFLKSNSNAASGYFGKLALNSTYANANLSDYTLDVNGRARIGVLDGGQHIINGNVQINSTSGSYNEGLRINRSKTGYANIYLGGTRSSPSGNQTAGWWIGTYSTPHDATSNTTAITDTVFTISNNSTADTLSIKGTRGTTIGTNSGWAIKPRLAVGTTYDTNYTLKVAGTSWLQGPVRIGNADTAGTETGNNGYAVANSGSTNYIAFYGTYNDGPGSFNHTYIGESIYGSTTTANEQSELLLFKGNDISTTAGPDRIRLFAREVDIQVYESNTSGSWDTIRQATGTQVANFKKGEVTVDGNITADTFTGDLAGNADTATLSDKAKKLTDLSTTDNASSTTTWRKIWMSYNDGTTGRPALTENLAYQTSTNTFKSPHFLAQHTAGGSQEFRVTYSTTIDFWMGVGTQNANHGIYDEKKGEWILLAGSNNKWTFAGNADTSTTATNLANAPTIKQNNTVVTDLSENTSYTLNVGGQSVSFKTPIDEKVTQNVLANTTNKKYGILTSAYETSSTSSTATTVNRDSKVYINPSLNQVAAGQFTLHDKAASPIEKVSLKWNSTDLALEFVFS